MAIGLVCWRCEEPGHGYTECHRPPAGSPAELGRRIARLVERWDAGYGELSTQMKTKLAETEITAYRKARKAS